MKKILLAIVIVSIALTGFSQDCHELFADVKKGTLNKVKPAASQEQVKAILPCSTGETEEGSDINCGGGIFFLKNDFFFYTDRDYTILIY